jgi:alkaline phosphatase
MLYATGADAAEAAKLRPYKNVIVMVPDGCGVAIQALARWYRGEVNTVDELLVGTVRTFMFDSIITDSAAAATAFATGQKTSDGFIGVGPRREPRLSVFEAPPLDLQYRPLASVLEAAKRRGKATGLVATSAVAHATPASFGAHVYSRTLMNEIMEQLVYQDIDVVFGGGKRYLLPQSAGGARVDRENLKDVLVARGYTWVETREELATLPARRVWGMFADDNMSPALDRPLLAPRQPTLAEMTAKALDILSHEPNGFFLFVEGSQVDWADHANDPIYSVTEFVAFDEAVKVALEFAEGPGRDNTLLLAFPDHATGGLSVGNAKSDGIYTKMRMETFVAPLRQMKLTAAALARKIPSHEDPKDKTKRIYRAEDIRDALFAWWPVFGADKDGKLLPPPATVADEVLSLVAAGRSLDGALITAVAKKYTYVGWTTTGHCGDDVPLWSYGSELVRGSYDNTDLAELAAEALGVSLPALTSELYVDANAALGQYEWDLVWEIDVPDDPATKDKNEAFRDNAVLIVGKSGRRCALPVNKDVIRFYEGDRKEPLEERAIGGITVHAPERDKAKLSAKPAVYLSSEAIAQIASFLPQPAGK